MYSLGLMGKQEHLHFMKLHWGDVQIGDASQNASSFLPFPSLNLLCRVMLCQLQPSNHPLTDAHTHTPVHTLTEAHARTNTQSTRGWSVSMFGCTCSG